MTENRMKLILPSKSVNEGFARAAVGAFAAQADPTCDIVADIKTAVSEAVTNCIVHAYRETAGDIYITAKLTKDEKIVIKIADRGCGIVNVEQAMQPLFTTGGEERSGLGFTVMESFCDRVKLRSSPGKGTVVTLYKSLRNAGKK